MLDIRHTPLVLMLYVLEVVVSEPDLQMVQERAFGHASQKAPTEDSALTPQPVSETVVLPSTIFKTLEEIKQENVVVRAHLDKQDQLI